MAGLRKDIKSCIPFYKHMGFQKELRRLLKEGENLSWWDWKRWVVTVPERLDIPNEYEEELREIFKTVTYVYKKKP